MLGSLGVSDIVASASADELLPVLASIKVDLLSGGTLLSASSAGAETMEASLRQALGDVSAGFPALLQRSIAPRLAGLAERLEAPGAAFLDIGVGVGALSVSMLREWPELRAVGIDPSYGRAHDNLGLALESRRDIAGAEAHFRLALGDRRVMADAHRYLGNLLERRGQLQEARQHWRQSLEADPHQHDAQALRRRIDEADRALSQRRPASAS